MDENLYEILEVSPDSSPMEIRNSYLRLKDAYGKESLALYSIMSADDTEEILKKIEKAYEILSQAEKRAEYDLNFGFSRAPSPHLTSGKIISIDRVPPMETGVSEDILVAPKTDFATAQLKNKNIDLPEITPYTIWSGEMIQKYREARGLSLEEISNFTKISKKYLHAIEQEDLKALPARAYLRGFLIQFGKMLKVPAEEFANSYIKRVP